MARIAIVVTRVIVLLLMGVLAPVWISVRLYRAMRDRQ